MWAITPGETGATSNRHRQREVAFLWPFDGRETVRRQSHQTVKGEARWAGEKGGSGTLVRGGGSPTAQIIAQGSFSGGVVITGSGIYRGVSLQRPTYNFA